MGVAGDRIGQWARWGHIRASVSSEDPHVYSFDDVADALAVHLLLRDGHGLPAIRAAVLRGVRFSAANDVFEAFGALPLQGRVDARALLGRGGWPTLVTGVSCVRVSPDRAAGRPCVRGRRVLVADAVAEPSAYGITERVAGELRRWWDASAAA